ncbi:MAG: T9SS type A sorting domain-containing protein [Ignavibacteriaceae bacterium]
MKNSILIIIVFIAFVTLAFSGLYERDLLGGTQLNGSGCVCHTTEIDTSVTVWIEGPDTLIRGETGLYRMYLANGPAEAGGHNVAGRFGIMSLVDTLSVWDSRSPNELTQAFPLEFPTPQDTIYWEFAYTAPDSVVVDTLYSCGLSLVYDHIPDALDRWNYGPKFPVAVIENVVPVELISFSAITNENSVLLLWKTVTETNNQGFQIEKRKTKDDRSEEWERIGFVNGNGTTTQLQAYTFNDAYLVSGNYQYRLKQIDFDGTYSYSNIVEIEILNPNEFVLEQNYPNPFNPSTSIKYTINSRKLVQLKIYDVLGNEVSTLVNDEKSSGVHTVHLNMDNLSSGIYFYELKAGNFIQTRKMILLK